MRFELARLDAHLSYSRAVAVIFDIDADESDHILVVGDPDNGGYEWCIERDGKVDAHSDKGYGIATIALRDGLIAYYGLPPTEVDA